MKENILLTLITIGVFGSFIAVHSIDYDYELAKYEMAAAAYAGNLDQQIYKEDIMVKEQIKSTIVASLRALDYHNLCNIEFNDDRISIEFKGYLDSQILMNNGKGPVESFDHRTLGSIAYSNIPFMTETFIRINEYVQELENVDIDTDIDTLIIELK